MTKLQNSRMRPQFSAILVLLSAVTLFLFSMALLPPVELYCRMRVPAVALFVAQIMLLVFVIRRKRPPEQRVLAIANFVFIALGLAFNLLLLISARGKC